MQQPSCTPGDVYRNLKHHSPHMAMNLTVRIVCPSSRMYSLRQAHEPRHKQRHNDANQVDALPSHRLQAVNSKRLMCFPLLTLGSGVENVRTVLKSRLHHSTCPRLRWLHWRLGGSFLGIIPAAQSLWWSHERLRRPHLILHFSDNSSRLPTPSTAKISGANGISTIWISLPPACQFDSGQSSASMSIETLALLHCIVVLHIVALRKLSLAIITATLLQ